MHALGPPASARTLTDISDSTHTNLLSQRRPVDKTLDLNKTTIHPPLHETNTQMGSLGNKAQQCKIELNLETETVKMHINLPIRHIFTFPFIGMHSLMISALEMGIQKAETQQTTRQATRPNPHTQDPSSIHTRHTPVDKKSSK